MCAFFNLETLQDYNTSVKFPDFDFKNKIAETEKHRKEEERRGRSKWPEPEEGFEKT